MIKPAENHYSRIRDGSAKKNFPFNMFWEVTQRCCLACRHCYLGGRHEDGELGTEEAKDLLRQAAEMGTFHLVITGGEPLLRKDLFEILEEVRRLGFTWKILTTGVLIGEEEAARIAEHEPLSVDISIHGLEAAHDGLAGRPGAFRGAVRGVELLCGNGVPVVMKTCVTPAGMGDLEGVRDLAERTGAMLRTTGTIFADLEGNPVEPGLCLAEEQMACYYKGIAEYRGGDGGYGRHRLPGGEEFICNAGRSTFAVSPSGDVRACLTLREVCGNVRERPLKEIWNSAGMERARRLLSGGRSGCEGCEDAEYCSFCPGQAEIETGNPLTPYGAACREARVRRTLAEQEGAGGAAGDD